MKNLTELRRFARIKIAEGNQSEVRAYLIENLDAVAKLFAVRPDVIASALEKEADDVSMAEKLLGSIVDAEDRKREKRTDTRAREATAFAEALAGSVRWQDDRAHFDALMLLDSAPLGRKAFLVLECPAFTVGVAMSVLLDLAKIDRVRADLTGWVDADGLHLRWKSGGLKLRSRMQADAPTALVRLPARTSSIVAA
jgi:hypothetical protein